jgi:hypothetical protein
MTITSRVWQKNVGREWEKMIPCHCQELVLCHVSPSFTTLKVMLIVMTRIPENVKNMYISKTSFVLLNSGKYL